MIAKILKRKVSRIHMDNPDPSQLSTSPAASSPTAAAAAKLSTSPSTNGQLSSSQLPLQYKYQRPDIITAGYSDEDLSSFASHASRPVVGPADGPAGPVGYAESINAGKSRFNEDQATVHEGKLVRRQSENYASF